MKYHHSQVSVFFFFIFIYFFIGNKDNKKRIHAHNLHPIHCTKTTYHLRDWSWNFFPVSLSREKKSFPINFCKLEEQTAISSTQNEKLMKRHKKKVSPKQKAALGPKIELSLQELVTNIQRKVVITKSRSLRNENQNLTYGLCRPSH